MDSFTEIPRWQRGFRAGGVEGDLFRGTAPFYAEYRRSYPEAVVTYLVREFGLDGRGRLMDAGCGTGQLFQVLSPAFEEVIAFDPDPEMVEYASRLARERHLRNVRVIRMKAEEIGPKIGTFRMAAFAASFHWTDRLRVAELVYDHLEPGGHLIVIAPCSPYSGTTTWEASVREVISKWLGPTRRAGGGYYQPGERHAQVLQRTRFDDIRTTDLFVEEQWTLDEVVGYLYSTSFASREVLADLAEAFETDLRARLSRLNPGGIFSKLANYTLISACRTADPARITTSSGQPSRCDPPPARDRQP